MRTHSQRFTVYNHKVVHLNDLVQSAADGTKDSALSACGVSVCVENGAGEVYISDRRELRIRLGEAHIQEYSPNSTALAAGPCIQNTDDASSVLVRQGRGDGAVSYTHLTLPTICSV